MFGFEKEVLLTGINTLNNFETLKFIGSNVYLVPFLLIFFLPLITSIIIYYSTKKSYIAALLVSSLMQIILILLSVMGLLPLWLSL